LGRPRERSQAGGGRPRRIDAFGVDVTLDGFLERWDLDRDGKVSASELSLWARK
jgi:hypothetical protein